MTVFTSSLELFINLSKVIGLINFCITFDKGLLNRDTYSTYNVFLELIRTFVFVVSSWHIFFSLNTFYSLHYVVVKYWSLIITARMFENRIIKFINGMIRLDRKLVLFNSIRLLPNVHTDLPRRRFWTGTIIAFYTYNLGFRVFYGLQYTISFVERSYLLHFLFAGPESIVFAVLITSCFHLYNVGHRFRVLTALWLRLPRALVAAPGTWMTDTDVAMLVECLRLLHAELSDLLRMFSRGYGPVLLVYFVFTFFHAMLETFLIVIFKGGDLTTGVMPFIYYVNHVFNMVSILCVTSWAIEKKKRIIIHLRSLRISELPAETKLQVKIFMNQILFYEPNEATAYGFFNLNLRLTTSMLVLLIMVLATTIQMKKHPILIYLHRLLGIQYQFKS